MVESFLQVGVLLGDGLLEDGLLELRICRQSELQGERVAGRASCSGGVTSAGWSSAGRWSGGRGSGGRWRDRWSGVCLQLAVCCFCSCFDLLVSAFVFAVIVICFKTGLG